MSRRELLLQKKVNLLERKIGLLVLTEQLLLQHVDTTCEEVLYRLNPLTDINNLRTRTDIGIKKIDIYIDAHDRIAKLSK